MQKHIAILTFMILAFAVRWPRRKRTRASGPARQLRPSANCPMEKPSRRITPARACEDAR